MPISDRPSVRPAAVARWAAFGLAGLALSGCLPPGGSLAFRQGSAAVHAVRVSDNDVTIAGPKGYCVDPTSSRERPAGSFVMLGSCATLRGAGEGPGKPAVLTALVSPRSDPPLVPDPAQLERFFRSDAGHAALAHDGNADSVTLLSIVAEGPVLYLKLRDRSTGRPADLSDVAWRAIFPLADRLVALSVTGHDDLPVADTDMRRTLDRFVAAVMAANAGPEGERDT
ncbi:hypothetical protein DKT77_09395 [Meridianimarinicoccus roseus]|jgi:hypothetical protein|uniref:Cation transport ATPase n=1 Tax=Meridianimarinicoccus roseus TaxID=2072018 RepID=A0A2V2LH13_9RHOB|nr:hypothetical protein [Meridianimarinicoccus roseus]PWR02784.1 hypothetical protein DKT77_09395 [Meridianimarinicoccus roseus]